MDAILDYPIYDGTTLRALLSAEFLLGLMGSVLAAFAILAVGWVLARWVRRRIERVGRLNERLDPTLFDFLGDLAWYAIVALTVVVVLNTFGVQTTSIVAIIGAAGLAIGLALQGTLSNIAAGVMLILFRPIRVGQFVEVDGVMGTVKDISLNYTELADLTNTQIIVPNANVWGNTITNYSANPLRRVEWIFGVAYGADLSDARTAILETIMADPRAMHDPEPFIQVTNLGDFSVDVMVRVWCQAGDFWGFKTDMTRAVKEALDAAGVEIPFPTRTLSYADAPIRAEKIEVVEG
ncbi:MAG: mechanosensitive ion channel family protein [Paracoccaceae bacterium]